MKVALSLNSFLAQAGICSRRKAAEYIKAGDVLVNEVCITEPGYRVQSTDVVKYKNNEVAVERKVYILLNKPKDVITTVADERGRKTVMGLLTGVPKCRFYPVGRLDRNTTGLLVLTNDGELAQRLSHPRYEIEKVYSVELDRSFKSEDVLKLQSGLELEDGRADIDEFMFLENKRHVMVSLHSGKNHIVRRMFKHLGYEIKKLDRVCYAGLTKKGLGKGEWRYLTEREVNILISLDS